MRLGEISDRLRRFSNRRRAKAVADSISARSGIKIPGHDHYRSSGATVAGLMTELLSQQLGSLDGTQLLDFGAGTGRIAIPFAEMNRRASVTCVDVDAEAVEFVSLAAPKNCRAVVGPYVPPLSFADEMFDGVWAVSVWSHFPEELATDWLVEMRRITRPGAALILSFASFRTMEEWQETRGRFRGSTPEDLKRKRFLYEQFESLDPEHFPGISGQGSWGDTLIHPDYVTEEWGKLFTVERFDRLPGGQELAILRRED